MENRVTLMQRISNLVARYNYLNQESTDGSLYKNGVDEMNSLFSDIGLLVEKWISIDPDVTDACIAEDRYGFIKIDVYESEPELEH